MILKLSLLITIILVVFYLFRNSSLFKRKKTVSNSSKNNHQNNNTPDSNSTNRTERILQNLIKNLEFGDSKDKRYALQELKEYESRAAIPALILALTDADQSINEAAHALLETIDPNWKKAPEAKVTIEKIIAKLSSLNEKTQRRAKQTLVDLKYFSNPIIIRLLNSKEDLKAGLKLDFLNILFLQKLDSPEIRSTLIKLSYSENAMLNEQALKALLNLDSLSREELSQLSDLFDKEEQHIRLLLLGIFKKHINLAQSHIKPIIKLLFDLHKNVRTEAYNTLLEIGINSIPFLTKTLSDKEKIREDIFDLTAHKYKIKFSSGGRSSYYSTIFQARSNISWHTDEIIAELWRGEKGLLASLSLIKDIKPTVNESIIKAITLSINDDNEALRVLASETLIELDAKEKAIEYIFNEKKLLLKYPQLFICLDSLAPLWQRSEEGLSFIILMAKNLLSTKNVPLDLDTLIPIFLPIKTESIEKILTHLVDKNASLSMEYQFFEALKGKSKNAVLPPAKPRLPLSSEPRKIGFKRYDDD